jgi:type IV secretion system protein VirB9
MRFLVPTLVLTTLLIGAVRAEAQTPASTTPPPRPLSPPLSSRVIAYGAQDIVPLRAQVRFTTMIVLPTAEQILDITCGDKELWLVNAVQNFAYVKPAKVGSQTNLNLLTASGTVYSFVLTEITGIPGAFPDVKVYLEPKDATIVAGVTTRPVFVPAQQVEDYRRQMDLAREEAKHAGDQARASDEAARQAKAAAQASLDHALADFRATYPTRLRFPYTFPPSRKPFQVTAIFHDDTCTYIQANPAELPALYEVLDGKPNLVTFTYRDGTYIVPKVLDQGYLAIGRARFYFARVH